MRVGPAASDIARMPERRRCETETRALARRPFGFGTLDRFWGADTLFNQTQ